MISLIGTALNQWDVGRSVTITESEATHVHFANLGDTKAVIMELVESQSKIPDYLLQTGKQLCVYAVANGVTIERRTFPVTRRERPEYYDYEDDQRNYIYALIQAAEEATANAERVAEELKTARDNGEFNGPQGERGPQGPQGPKEVYAATYDFASESLVSNFSEMVSAFQVGKIVTLSTIYPLGEKECYYCVRYDTEETSGYEGACLVFQRAGAGYTESLYVVSDGTMHSAITNLGNIEAALDGIIEIQNSLIGGESA